MDIGLIVGIVVLGLGFSVFAIFPKLDFFLVGLWVRSEDPTNDIRPTRFYVIWTRSISAVCAIGLFIAAGSLIAVEHRAAQERKYCNDVLTALHNLYDDDGFIDEEDAAEVAAEFGAEIETQMMIYEGDAYLRVTVQREDFKMNLVPDTDIAALCEARF